MESNRYIFLRMTEEFYLDIPEEIREIYLRDKCVNEETGDWAENMQDPTFAELSTRQKEIKEQVRERQYQLREQRRTAVNNIVVNDEKVFDPASIPNEDF